MTRLLLASLVCFGSLCALAKEFPCGASLQGQSSLEKAALSQTTSGWTTGNKKLVVLRLEFPGQVEATPNELQCREMMEYADRVLRTNSYGTFSLSSTIAPVIGMPKPESEFADLAEIETVAWEVASEGGIRREDFDLDVVVGVRQLGNGSYGNIGTRGVMMNRAAANSIIVHELGHNLGLLHARSWVGYNDSISGAGEGREYGDAFDIMGSGDRSFNSWAKRHLGWLPPESVRDVTNSQTIDIAFHESEGLEAGATYALRIPAGDKVYWVDCQLPTAQARQMADAILVRWALPVASTASTYLLDMRPETVLGTTDASLLLGRTFSDERRKVHITPIKKNANGFSVEVKIGEFAGNRPPEVTVSAANVLQLEIGASFQVSATASDPDGDPVSITWDFGNGIFGIGATVSDFFAAAGEYSVVCEASDHKGGVTTKSIIARVGSPTTFRLSGMVTRNGAPMPNARIYIPGQEAWSGRSGSDGRYVLTGLLPGTYEVRGAFQGLYLRPLTFQNPIFVSGTQEDLNWDCPNISANDLSLQILEDSEQNAVRLTGQSQSGTMSFQIQDFPTHGILAGSSPALRYTPDPNFAGDDFFTYYARDGELRSSLATVSITVQSQADPAMVFGQAGGRAETVMTTRLKSVERNIWITDVCTAGDGLVYVLGDEGSNSADHIYIRALNSSGSSKWERNLKLSPLDVPAAILPRRDGVVVTGQSYRNTIESWIARLSSDGEALWLNQLKDSKVLVAEWRGEDALLVCGVEHGSTFVAKVDGVTGRDVWHKAGPSGFNVNHADVGDDGGFAATGWVAVANSETGRDCVTLKFSATGDLLWSRSFDKQNDEQGFHVHVAQDGSVYTASDGHTPNPTYAVWISHYSETGTLLWQTSPMARPPLAAPIVFDREDVPHVLTVDPAFDNRSVLLRFKTNVAERLWVSSDANSVWPFALRIASGGAFEAITADVLANPATAWCATIGPEGGEISHVRLRLSGAYWQGVIARAGNSAQSVVLAETISGASNPRIVKVVNDALPQMLTMTRDQSLSKWPAPIAIENKPLMVEATVLPEHGVLSGFWPDWIYRPVEGYTGEDRIGYKAWHTGEQATVGEFRIRVAAPLDLRMQEGSSGDVILTADPETGVSWSRDLKEWAPLRGRIPTTLNFDGDHSSKFFQLARENEIP